MPRYDYKCEANGHVFEVTQGFNDEPGAICPEDGSKSERQISIPHVIYKGSGFYTTDYKNSSSSTSNGSNTSSSSGSDVNGDSGSSSTASKSSESNADSSTKSSSAKSE
jgi:putative FmdB family regulatory protein